MNNNRPGFFFVLAFTFASANTALALEGPGRALIVSTTQQLAADTERTGFNVKEFIVPYAGRVRVSWQYKTDGGGGVVVTASVTSNVDTCGKSTTSTVFTGAKCDIRVAAGDKITVSTTGSEDINTFMFATPTIRNVRVFYSVVDSNGTGLVVSD
jgi:hypothetical protein